MQIPLVDDLTNENLDDYYIFDSKQKDIVMIDFLKMNSNNLSQENKDILKRTLCIFRMVRIAHRNLLENDNVKFLTYCNYFYQYFDTDKKFLMDLMFVKRTIDLNFSKKDEEFFTFEYFTKELLRKVLLTKVNIDKIHDMVLYNNVIIDYEETEYNGPEYTKFDKVHCDLLYSCSIAIRLLIPLINHFMFAAKAIGQNDNELLSNLIKYIIALVNQYFCNRYHIEVNIIQKLNESMITNADSNFNANKLLFDKLTIYGKTSVSLSEKMLDSIITVAFPKYLFNGNIIHLNIGFLDQIKKSEKQFNSPKPSTGINEIDRDGDGLSKLDKIEIDTKKDDESKMILIKIAIEKTIESLIKTYGEVSREEIQYYMNNVDIMQKNQFNAVSLWFGKYFNSVSIFKFLKIHQYALLVALMMRMMKRKGYIILQYILTGRVTSINRKSINSKAYKRIDPRIEKIVNYKYSKSAQNINKSNAILNLLSFALFANMTLISYDNDKMRGARIDVNRPSEDLVIEEVLRFISEI
ncbi:hypothetical protein DLH72_04500 [Candidatus Gracilibacteria bacterium]|nr:MAG: hypothetical protein DLH72_04500 [Candidatus Gracilibacteria bacterium]